MEEIDPSFKERYQRLASLERKKKPIKINIIHEQQSLPSQQEIKFQHQQPSNNKIEFKSSLFLKGDATTKSDKKLNKKDFSIDIAPLEIKVEETLRSNSENVNMLQDKKIDNYNPFIDNYLGIDCDNIDDHSQSSESPLRILSQEISAIQKLEITQKNYLSPTKIPGLQSRNQRLQLGGQVSDMSPMSSYISGFYLDRIDELLPEKKLVTEKLFKGKDQHQQILQEDTPFNRVDDNNRQSINFKQRYENKFLSKFQRRKEKLRYKLQFPRKQDYIDDKNKKKSAQALKFLRKLGRKLRRPQAFIKQGRQINIKKQSDGVSSQFNYFESPAKSCITIESNETRISPRQALIKQQQKNDANYNNNINDGQMVFSNFQFQLHQTGGSEDNISSGGNSSAKYRDIYKANNQSQVPKRKTKQLEHSPSFEVVEKPESTIFYDPQGNFNAYDEIQELLSPIATRNHVKPELDEMEIRFMDAFVEYRKDKIYYDFNNYDKYKIDALQSNNQIEQNLGITRDSSISFKDQRFTIQKTQNSNQNQLAVTQLQQQQSNSTMQQQQSKSYQSKNLQIEAVKKYNYQKQSSIETLNPYTSKNFQIDEEDELRENDSPTDLIATDDVKRQKKVKASGFKTINQSLKDLQQILDQQEIFDLNKYQSHTSNQYYLNTEGDDTDSKFSQDFASVTEDKRSQSISKATAKKSLFQKNQMQKSMSRKVIKGRSNSKKRISIDPANKDKHDSVVYLDQLTLKQMKNSFKLLCEDIVQPMAPLILQCNRKFSAL
ncbi:UNKNOWN [Stylonychia lemnae]|uniref:Uncharacterized protein n=1 Tax=Stylonychia lemnae TaxID=5949 RepID=A0A078ABJ1_STYLE|nr:UNKNOWN [Stylonychia lemnae]|eukprot:CDW78153.1 UNKNOWN [Stylonychia lemnae]